MTAPPRSLDGPPGGGLRFTLLSRLGGEPFVRFKVDVSAEGTVVGDIERNRSDPIVERLGFARAEFPVCPLAQQFADKLHA